MNYQKKNIRNICCLYASDWHLAMMLLPYLSKKIEKEEQIETFLKNEISKNINELISKLSLNKQLEENMLNINWNTNEEEIENFMNNINFNSKEITIILNGKTKEVQENNKFINKWICKNIEKLKDTNISIISCFRALEDGNNVTKLINNYEYALNTSGEHKIEEIFNMYKKVISY